MKGNTTGDEKKQKDTIGKYMISPQLKTIQARTVASRKAPALFTEMIMVSRTVSCIVKSVIIPAAVL